MTTTRPAKHDSFFVALRTAGFGFYSAFIRESNLRWQVAGCGIVVLLAVLLGMPGFKIMFVVVVSFQVITLELINSAFEAMADIIHPKFHQAVGYAKDVMAAAVLTVSIAAIMIGVWVFVPAFVEMFT